MLTVLTHRECKFVRSWVRQVEWRGAHSFPVCAAEEPQQLLLIGQSVVFGRVNKLGNVYKPEGVRKLICGYFLLKLCLERNRTDDGSDSKDTADDDGKRVAESHSRLRGRVP